MRKKWLVAGLVVVALGAQGAASWLDRGDDKPVAVPTVAVDTGDVTVAVAATGTVRPASTRELGFGIDGTVATVAVRPGSVVRAGTVLATVDTTAAAAAVRQARDDLAAAESQLDAAERTAAAAATAPRGRSANGRPESAARGSGTPESAARGGGPEVPGGGRPENAADAVTAGAAAEIGRAGEPGTVTARATGLDAIFSATERVNRARAALAEARAALAGGTLTAPIAGTVMSVAGQVGSRVGKGAPFLTLADTQTMRVAASFPEADAGRLAVGQPATVTLPDRVGERFPAEVVQVDPAGTADGDLVTYGVLVSFRNQPAGLLPGQRAAVEIRTAEVTGAVRVPSTAVRDSGRGRGRVLVRTGVAQVEREVTVGLRGDLYTQITDGLTAGEVVVRAW